MTELDDSALRRAMQDWLDACARLDEATSTGLGVGDAPRVVLDLAEAKTLAGLELRQRLVQLGWTAPAHRALNA